jgi:hypothetical protein
MEIGSCAAEKNGMLARHQAWSVGVGSYEKLFESDATDNRVSKSDGC